MVQILPGTSRSAMLGQAVGSGLGQGLQLLLQDKMNNMMRIKQQQSMASGLHALGFHPQQALQMANLPPEILNQVIKSKYANENRQGLPPEKNIIPGLVKMGFTEDEAKEYANLPHDTLNQVIKNKLAAKPQALPEKDIIPGLVKTGFTEEEARGYATLPHDILKEIVKSKLAPKLPGAQPGADIVPGLKVAGFKDEEAKQLVGLPLPLITQIMKDRRAKLEQDNANEVLSTFGDENIKPEQALNGQTPAGTTPVQLKNLGQNPNTGAPLSVSQRNIAKYNKILANPNAKPGLKAEVAKMKLKQELAEEKRQQNEVATNRKEVNAEKKYSWEMNKNTIDRIDEAADFARKDLENTIMQENYIQTGKLMGPKAAAALNFIGGKLGADENAMSAFKNGTTQAFEKASIPYFRDLKTDFGARPTQYDAQQLQKSFPSLYQSDSGKRVILEFMRHAALNRIKTQSVKDKIIDENNDTPPKNFNSKISHRMDKWRNHEWTRLTNKVSGILAKEYTEGNPIAVKGAILRSKKDPSLEFISDGKEWLFPFSTNQEGT